jgi:leucyl/phenylalanyl-tRNA---protein transferase
MKSSLKRRHQTLSPDLLLYGYTTGIFPMADADSSEIQWYLPKFRAVLPLDGSFHLPRSLRQILRKNLFEIHINRNFRQVMEYCAVERGDGLGTWISDEMVAAYLELHRQGYAHSVEAYQDGKLVGGLYGVAMGGVFFGESMFHLVSDASKVALSSLVKRLTDRGFSLLDSQFMNDNVRRFGAIEIPHQEFLERLHAALKVRISFVD